MLHHVLTCSCLYINTAHGHVVLIVIVLHTYILLQIVKLRDTQPIMVAIFNCVGLLFKNEPTDVTYLCYCISNSYYSFT